MEPGNNFINFRDRLISYLSQNTIKDFTSISNELIFISSKLRVSDVLYIFQNNNCQTLLVLNKDQSECTGVLKIIDFLNIIIHIGNTAELRDNPTKLENFMSNLKLSKMIRKYKTFMDRDCLNLVTLNIEDTLSNCISTFHAQKIGTVVTIVELGKGKSLRKELFSLFNKTDFLINMLRSFYSTRQDVNFLQTSIHEAFPEVIIPAEKLLCVSPDHLLIDVFRIIRDKKVHLQDLFSARY